VKRRDFLKVTGTFFVTASLGGIPGCGDNIGSQPDGSVPTGTFTFPHGVASGDPRPTSVVLWTRCVNSDDATSAIPVTVEVASDADFANIVAHQEVSAGPDADFTVRVVVSGLTAATSYHYRFRVGTATIAGQTRTAPAADANVPVNFAWVSCQDFTAGTYGAYKQMVADDEARAEADRIQFVVHLGDFIYETAGPGYHLPLDDDFQPITDLKNPDGTPRQVAAFPSGGGDIGAEGKFARTVDDYRHLYKTFLADPDLQAARARWPFIYTWDDHEFSNDCWQSQANYVETDTDDEGAQTRKYAANQAWFDYIPVQLTGAPDNPQAKDFTPTTVHDAMFTAPNADNFVDEPNNAAAVGSITIYRSFRFGQHLELVMTDERSYRSDHAIPEDMIAGNQLFFDPRNAIPVDLLNILDAGNTVPGGPPAMVSVPGAGSVPNPRANVPAGTLLGKPQKQWFLDTMKASTATWKVWGNEVPLARVLIVDPLARLSRVMSADAWDGYPSERREITKYFADQNIANVVVITGDIHAQFAAVIPADYDAAALDPIAVELTTAGIASNSLFSFYEGASRAFAGTNLRKILTYDASASGGSKFVENMNMLVLHGQASALRMASGGTLEQALAERVTINDTVKYADTNSQGYGLLSVTADQVTGALVTINRPVMQSTTAPGVKRTASFTIPKDNPGGMTGPEITGEKPFPLT